MDTANQNNTPNKGDEMEDRLINFASFIIILCNKFPKTQTGQDIASQLFQCGTAPAAYYAEARSAENARDVIDKLKLGLKNLNGSRVWLKITAKSQILSADSLQSALKECDELSRIFEGSIKNTRKRLNN